MLPTYKALLQGDHLIWLDGEPEAIKKTGAVLVYVTIAEDASSSDSDVRERGRKMGELLNRLAERNALSEIDDPVMWQRDLRRERTLPDRN